MFSKPNDVSGIPAPDFFEERLGKFVEFLLEEALVAIRRIQIAATHNVAEPEDEEEIAIDPSGRRIAE
jgi:hypothetical protein